jgi:hypothetical protein
MAGKFQRWNFPQGRLRALEVSAHHLALLGKAQAAERPGDEPPSAAHPELET